MSVIGAALDCPKHSRARGREITKAAAAIHVDHTGRQRSLSEATLRAWIARFEKGGLDALVSRPSNPPGIRRVRVSRKWDRRCGLDVPTRYRVSKELERQVRRLAARHGGGWRRLARLASPLLLDATRRANATLPESTAAEICEVPRQFIENALAAGW